MDEEEPPRSCDEECSISLFDYSVENHFKAVDSISDLCGEASTDIDKNDTTTLSSSVTFLREWRHFNYEPKSFIFYNEADRSCEPKDTSSQILPQFSSARAPKVNTHEDESPSSGEKSKDFVMNVGGSVWALEWCPRVHGNPDAQAKCEFLAVATHPPESYSHKIGIPLSGRGIIQIWCIIHTTCKNDGVHFSEKSQKFTGKSQKKPSGKSQKKPSGKSQMKPSVETIETTEPKKPRGRPRKHPIATTEPKKARGRPRKKSTAEVPVELNGDVLCIEAVSVRYPEDLVVPSTPLQILPATLVTEPKVDNESSGQVLSAENAIIKLPVRRKRHKTRVTEESSLPILSENSEPKVDNESSGQVLSTENAIIKLPARRKRHKTRVTEESCLPILSEKPVTLVDNESSGQVLSTENAIIKLPVRRKRHQTRVTEESCLPILSENSEAVENVPGELSAGISEDIALPRIVLCLAHNGKVAWDMKWRPLCADDSLNKQRMGFLAVLLGNGSLEVWDVPMPQAISALYLSTKKPETDPRFLKLAPVFKCSKLMCGNTQSIPLTVEWSTLGNPDFLLAGCHDGTVALWKFSTTNSSEDTRPLLFFSADTAPIRDVAWAPGESDQESANVIATAGHGGLKFWDLRDPFRPLWYLHPVPRFIYSLDWLQDPSCVLLTYDDGTIRILSLAKVAYDVPATGKPYPITKKQGLSVYICSSFPIWSIQVSRLTGIAAYCTADGSVFHFQLTTKAVEKDSRNRTPHFLCGKLELKDSIFTVHSPVPEPIILKKPVSETGEKQRNFRSLLNESPNRHTSDVPPPAFAHDEDPGLESETDGHNSKVSKKAKKGENTTAEEDENKGALVCVKENVDEEANNSSSSRNGMKAEGFPDKMVAMHRVRWNMNKGSERWLCYGGAAGIVRCQEIVPHGLVSKSKWIVQR